MPEVTKLVIDAYFAFVRYQKLSNVFYTIPWLTVSLLFPASGESPVVIKQEIDIDICNTNVVYCHDRLVDTLYAISMTLKDLKVLDGDSID